MDYMTLGYDSGDKSALEAVAYVSFQELATRVSHRNTGSTGIGRFMTVTDVSRAELKDAVAAIRKG
jgi:hypothetical protein